MMLFKDRKEAGRRLASHLGKYAGRDDVVVLGLPRGGVPVAFEVARELHAPLDVFIVRKLGAPGQPELAMGAIASGGVRILNPQVVRWSGASEQDIERATQSERAELERRERLYRSDREPPEVENKTVILVDDGLATGASMKAALQALKPRKPAAVVVAVPVAAPETCAEFENEVDEIVCAHTPHPFGAVGAWYRDFTQTSDTEVRELLQKAHDDFVRRPKGE